jgi:hypothetical protein
MEATTAELSLYAVLNEESAQPGPLLQAIRNVMLRCPSVLVTTLPALPLRSQVWKQLASGLSDTEITGLISIWTKEPATSIQDWITLAIDYNKALSQKSSLAAVSPSWIYQQIFHLLASGYSYDATAWAADLQKGLLSHYQLTADTLKSLSPVANELWQKLNSSTTTLPQSAQRKIARNWYSPQNPDRLLLLLEEQLTSPDIRKLTNAGYADSKELTAYLLDYHHEALWSSVSRYAPDKKRQWLRATTTRQHAQLLMRQPGLPAEASRLLDQIIYRLTHAGYNQVTRFKEKATLSFVSHFLAHPLTGKKELINLVYGILEKEGFTEQILGKAFGTGTVKDSLKIIQEQLRDNQWQEKRKKDTLSIPYFTEEEGKEYYIENAGLILLHPYLEHFFTQLGYLDPFRKFASSYQAARGAMLLQYLYNLQTSQEEEAMVLNKVLCGLHPESFVPAFYDPTDEEKDMCNQMIEAIISHWTIISAHDVAGFRDTWLWRTGKLTLKEEKYELKVDKQPYDILMDSLPFTLSPATLSWCDKYIYVEWR